MRPTNLLLTFLSAALAGAACTVTEGDGNIVEESRAVAAFHALDVSGPFHAFVTRGDAPSAVVRIDGNLQEHVDVSVTSGVLHVGAANLEDIQPTAQPEVRIVAPDLDAIEATGATELDVTTAPSGDLTIELSGAAILRAEGIGCDAVDFSSSGSTQATLEGRARELTAQMSGSATLDSRLGSESAAIDLSGSTHLTVEASREVSGSAAGSSAVTVVGDPAQRDIEMDGTSTIDFQ